MLPWEHEFNRVVGDYHEGNGAICCFRRVEREHSDVERNEVRIREDGVVNVEVGWHEERVLFEVCFNVAQSLG